MVKITWLVHALGCMISQGPLPGKMHIGPDIYKYNRKKKKTVPPITKQHQHACAVCVPVSFFSISISSVPATTRIPTDRVSYGELLA